MKAKLVILSLLFFSMLYASAHSENDKSYIPSYDTTYYEKGNKYRQIYVNGDTEETYILIKNDTIVLHDVEKKRR